MSEQDLIEAPITVTIPDDSPPDNDNGEGTEPATPANDNNRPPTQRLSHGTRKENKAERLRIIERAEAAERRAQAAEEAQRRFERELAEVRGRQQAYEEARRVDAGDPVTKRITEAHDNAWRKLQAAAADQDPGRSAQAMKEYHEALTAAAELAAERKMDAKLQQFRQQQPDRQATRQWDQLVGEFDWLESNHGARAMADGYVAYLTSKGRPWNMATYREACAMAAKEFGLGGAPVERPSEARRAAYGGVPGRQGGDEDGPTQLQIAPEVSPQIRRLAHLRYPDLEEPEALKKWLKNEGSRLAKQPR